MALFNEKEIEEFKREISECEACLKNNKFQITLTTILFMVKATICPNLDWVWVVSPLWIAVIWYVVLSIIAIPILRWGIRSNTSEATRKLEEMQTTEIKFPKEDKENG